MVTADSKTVSLTAREQQFVRAVKRYFGGSPADWSTPAMVAGTSSFLDYRDWLSDENVSLAVIEDVLAHLAETWREAHKYPSLRQIRSAYYRECRRAPSEKNCGLCGLSGCILVAIVRQGGRVYAVHPDRPIAAPWPALKRGNIDLSSAPCACDIGTKLAANWYGHGAGGPEPNQRARLMRYRLDSLAQYYALERECQAIADAPDCTHVIESANAELSGPGRVVR